MLDTDTKDECIFKHHHNLKVDDELWSMIEKLRESLGKQETANIIRAHLKESLSKEISKSESQKSKRGMEAANLAMDGQLQGG